MRYKFGIPKKLFDRLKRVSLKYKKKLSKTRIKAMWRHIVIGIRVVIIIWVFVIKNEDVSISCYCKTIGIIYSALFWDGANSPFYI